MKTNDKTQEKNVPLDTLILDVKNPRLPSDLTDENKSNLLSYFIRNQEVSELASSFIKNGLFRAEKIVVTPRKVRGVDNYVVLEGNRRVATLKALMNDELQMKISEKQKESFRSIPVIIYPHRNAAVGLMAVKHLGNVKKWSLYERVMYLVYLKEKKGNSLETISAMIGDKKNQLKTMYTAYKLIEIVKEFDKDLEFENIRKQFSFLMISINSPHIRRFIELADINDIEDHETLSKTLNLGNLKKLFLALFNSNEGKALIKDAREITVALASILLDEEATEELFTGRDLLRAFKMIGGEIMGIRKLIEDGLKKFQLASGKITSADLTKYANNSNYKDIKEMINGFEKILDDCKEKLV